MFEIKSTLSFNKNQLVSGNDYDYVTRTSLHQGVLQETNFVNENNLNEANVWSLGLLQMDFFYRKREWYAGQFVRKIIPKFSVNENNARFFSVILNKLKPVLLQVLVRNVDKTFENQIIYLPTKNNQIDFDFIDCFISELQLEHLSNLEVYLSSHGLDNYVLSIAEKRALQDYKNIEWREYKIGDLFKKIRTKKIAYKAKNLPNEAVNEFDLPGLTASFKNQGLNYYVPRKNVTVLKNVISIPSNSDVYRAYFQSREFTVISDAYAIEWNNIDAPLSTNQYLFMVMAINKVTDLPIYSYKMKLGGWNIVKNKYIALPHVEGNIALDFMDNFVKAISKLAIKDVAQYTNKHIKLPK